MPGSKVCISTPRTLSKKPERDSSKYRRFSQVEVDLNDDDQPSSKKAKDLLVEAEEEKIARPIKNKKFIGAHVSIAGGIHKSVEEAHEIGARAFALFLKSNHQWKGKALDPEDVALFRENCIKYKYPSHLIVPHACYLLNIAAPKEETLTKSRNALIEEIQRCEELGLTLFNVHPGSTCGTISKEEGIRRCAESINLAHAATKGVTILIENMCGQGNTLGGDFKELRDIISQVKKKNRVGMCLDTCHAFAYGYDLATENGFEKLMSDLENIVGLENLLAVHLNDSNGDVASHLDRHANIGNGKIGIEGFRRIMKDKRFNDIPMVLETPPKLGYKKEIDILNKLRR